MKNIRSIIFNFCSISTPVAVQYVNGTLAGPTRYIEVYKGFHWGHRNNVPVNQGIRSVDLLQIKNDTLIIIVCLGLEYQATQVASTSAGRIRFRLH
jgi:hypothetical protein